MPPERDPRARRRGRARRGRQGRRRTGGDPVRLGRRPARRRPRAARRRAGRRQDALVKALAASLDLDFKRVQFTPDLMPSDVIGQVIFEAGTAVPVPARGAGVHQPPPRRRDQPHAAEDPGRLAGGHGGAPGLRRGRGPPAARSVRRGRHPEPGRVRGHLPPARGPARPVPVQADRPLPLGRAGAAGARPARSGPRPARPGCRRAAGGGVVRRPDRRPARSRPCGSRTRCWPTSSPWPGPPGVALAHPRGLAARRHRPVARRQGLGVARRARLRHARRGEGRRQARVAPPHLLRPELELEGTTADGVLDGILATVPAPR